MTDRSPDGFDPIDPLERTRLRRVEAWTDQAVAPDDPVPVVRVTTASVRGRPSARVPGGRGPVLAAAALVTAVVVGAFVLRTGPADTSDAVPSPAGTVGAGATSDGAVAVATGPLETPYESLDPTAGPTPEPTPEPTPAPVATARPTAKPPKTPRPEPTDSWHTDWTPPPGFVGSLTVTDGCFHTNGTEQVIFTAEWDSPVELTAVRIYLDGDWLANGLGPGPDQHTGTVIVGRDLEVGASHVAEARFFTGPYNVDLVAVRESEPFVVQQGPPCPGG